MQTARDAPVARPPIEGRCKPGPHASASLGKGTGSMGVKT